MFVVLSGDVAVRLEPSQQQVATIAAGGFFGEMSALTGEPRTATVQAVTECQVLEIGADALGDLLRGHPELLEPIGRVMAERRSGLAEAQQVAEAAEAARLSRKATLLERIQQFLHISPEARPR
jgi:CRP-like cAMP-binding protein